jgi:hypothetical protein
LKMHVESGVSARTGVERDSRTRELEKFSVRYRNFLTLFFYSFETISLSVCVRSRRRTSVTLRTSSSSMTLILCPGAFPMTKGSTPHHLTDFSLTKRGALSIINEYIFVLSQFLLSTQSSRSKLSQSAPPVPTPHLEHSLPEQPPKNKPHINHRKTIPPSQLLVQH